MSDFVLKTAPWCSEQVSWLPGVKRVKRIESLPINAALDNWRNYSPDFEYCAEFGPEDNFVATLLFVDCDDYCGHLVVNQAWLVGPGGGTVDRLHSNEVRMPVS